MPNPKFQTSTDPLPDDLITARRAARIARCHLATLYRYMTSGTEPTRQRVLLAGIEGDEHMVSLGPLGSFSAHLLPGGMGGVPKIVDPPGADPFHREYAQGVTTKQTYTGSDQKWDWSNSNYMFGSFEVTSDEFDKFAVAMTQHMEKMKSEKKPQ